MRRRISVGNLLKGALAAAVVGVYVANLWKGSLFTWDESLTAERSREIAVTGDWLTPHCQLQPDFRKPPLYYWLTAVTASVVGWDEFTVRVWSALFGMGCIVLVGLIASRASGDGVAGLAASFLLASNAHWVNWTRIGHLDSAFLCSVLAGIYLLIERPLRTRSLWLAGAAFALGALAKFPFTIAGLAVPLAFRAGNRSGDIRRILRVVLPVFVAFGLSWYALQVARWGRSYFDQFFAYNIATRVTAVVEGHRSGNGFYLRLWWREAPVHLALFAGLALWAVVWSREALRRHAVWLVTAGVTLAILAAMASKRQLYLVYVHPFAAVAGALVLAEWVRGRRAAVAACGLAAVAAAAVVVFAHRYIPVIDESSAAKAAGRAIAARSRPGDVVYAHRRPPYALMFYSGVLTREFDGRLLDALRSDPDGGRGRRVFIVAEARHMTAILNGLREGTPGEIETTDVAAVRGASVIAVATPASGWR